MPGCAKICQDMSRCVKICQEMSRYVKRCPEGITTYVKICQYMSRYVKTFQDMTSLKQIIHTNALRVCMYVQYVCAFIDPGSDVFVFADLCSLSCELLAQDLRVLAFVFLQPEATDRRHEPCATRRPMQCLRSNEPEASQVRKMW